MHQHKIQGTILYSYVHAKLELFFSGLCFEILSWVVQTVLYSHLLCSLSVPASLVGLCIFVLICMWLYKPELTSYLLARKLVQLPCIWKITMKPQNVHIWLTGSQWFIAQKSNQFTFGRLNFTGIVWNGFSHCCRKQESYSEPRFNDTTYL